MANQFSLNRPRGLRSKVIQVKSEGTKDVHSSLVFSCLLEWYLCHHHYYLLSRLLSLMSKSRFYFRSGHLERIWRDIGSFRAEKSIAAKRPKKPCVVSCMKNLGFTLR